MDFMQFYITQSPDIIFFYLAVRLYQLCWRLQAFPSFSGSTFDPLGQTRGPAPALEAKNEDTSVFCSAYIMPNA